MNADQILGIEVSDSQRTSYLEKSDTRYTNLHLEEEIRQAFGSVNVYPTLFFVDGEGTVVKHLLNFQDRETLEAVIQGMLQ